MAAVVCAWDCLAVMLFNTAFHNGVTPRQILRRADSVLRLLSRVVPRGFALVTTIH